MAPSVFYEHHLIYQGSAPAALLEDEPLVDSEPFSQSPGPVARGLYYEGESQPIVEEVPPIGSGWFDDAPPVVFPRPRYFESTTAFLDDVVVVVVGDLVFTESPGPTLRVLAPPSRTDHDYTDVPPIGSGWFTNPPDLVERPGYYESPSGYTEEDGPDFGPGWFTNPPDPVERVEFFLSTTDFEETEVPPIASGWYDDPPIVVLRPSYIPSEATFLEADVPDIGVGWFTNPPDVVERHLYFESRSEPQLFQRELGEDVFTETALPVLRIPYFESPSAITEEDVPEIGSGWFHNPPPVILRPFVAFPGEPPGDLEEGVAVEGAFSEGPYLLLRRPFHESSSEPQLADVQPIGSGWFTNPPVVVLRPGYFLSVAEPTVEPVPEIGSGWYTDAPSIIFRPGFFPSTTELPFDIAGAPIVVKGPLSAILVHTGQSMAIEVTTGIQKADEVPSTIAGFAFLVHQGNLVAEEITDGTQKADEC